MVILLSRDRREWCSFDSRHRLLGLDLNRRAIRNQSPDFFDLLVSDRDAAERLRNLELYIPRTRLPEIDEKDTYYHADLIGLDVVTPEGVQIGTVHALHNFGAGDIIEIMPVGSGEPVMLPFNDATVPKVDLKTRQIVLVQPVEIETRGE